MNWTLLLLLQVYLVCIGAQQLTVSSKDGDVAPFEVGSELSVTCSLMTNNDSLTIEYQNWISSCSINEECFAIFRQSGSTNISTIDRSLVPVLTSVDNGNYTCTANLSDGTYVESRYSVNVTGVSVYEQVTNTLVTDDQRFYGDSDGNISVILHCIGASGPGNWTDPDGLPIDGLVLEVLELYGSSILSQGPSSFTDPMNEGYYTCTGLDETGMEDMIQVGLFAYRSSPGQAPLNVSLSSRSGIDAILLNTPLTLDCITNETLISSPFSYTWSFKDMLLDFNTSSNTFTISQVSQYGVYTCNVSNEYGWIVDEVNIRQAFIPEIISSNYSTNIISPANLTLNCTVRAFPRPTIHWEYTNSSGAMNTLNGSFNSISDNIWTSILHIPNTDPTNAGIYTCSATNEFSTAVFNGSVNVYVTPTLSSLLSSYTVNENSSVTFTCTGTGVPQPVITWYRNGSVINDNDKYSISFTADRNNSTLIYHVNGSLTISQAFDNDSDTMYTCKATNIVGSAVDSFELNVLIAPVIIGPPLSQITIQPNSTNFTCVTTGLPRPVIRWYRQTESTNNEIVSVMNGSIQITETVFGNRQLSSSLVIPNTVASDVGNYTCEATNVVIGYNNSAVLTVHVTPTLSSLLSSYIVNENSSVTFTCTGTGVPQPVITWYRNGSVINDDRFVQSNTSLRNSSTLIYHVKGSLNLTNAYDTDTGTNYQCTVSNAVSDVSQSFSLTVNFGARMLTAPMNNTIIEYSNVSFTCTVYGYVRPTVQWTYYSAVITSDGTNNIIVETVVGDNERTSVLTLVNVTRDRAGIYQCTGNNTLNTITGTANLTVNFIPDIIVSPVDSTVIQPATGVFNCSANGLPRPVIGWVIKGGTPLLSSSLNYTISTTNTSSTGVFSSLMVSSTSPLDTGDYYCTITNSVKTVNSSIAVLTVYVTPTLSSLLSSYTVNENSSVTFTCTGTGVPQPVITWYRNGSVINDDRFVQSNTSFRNSSTLIYHVKGSLNLTNAYDTDTGTNYQCTVSNAVSDVSQSFSLTVNFGTRMLTAPMDDTITEYSNVSFTCTVYGYERPTVQWTYSSTVITSDGTNSIIVETVVGDNELTSVLTLVNVTRDRAGIYQCTGRNTLNTITGTANLTVNFIPDIIVSPVDSTVIQPATGVFNCSANGLPRPIIGWVIKGGTPLLSSSLNYTISATNTSSTGVFSSLMVSSTSPLDTGNYYCTITNSVKTVNSSIAVLTVYVTPTLSSLLSSYTVNENSTVTFTCTGTGVPQPVITWYRNGTLINDNDKYSISFTADRNNSTLIYHVNGSLTISQAFDNDSDTMYTCNATNIVGSAVDSFELNVQIAPVIIGPPLSQITIQPNSTNFTCVTTGLPRPVIRWYRQTESANNEIVSVMNGSIQITETVFGNRQLSSSLVIPSTVASDVGNYTCEATNVVIGYNNSAVLTVHVTPHIIYPVSNQSFTVNESDSITILCSTTGIPSPSITWYRESVLLSQGSPSGSINDRIVISDPLIQDYPTNDGILQQVNSSLTLNANGSDTGRFTCTANNVVTNVSTDFNIFVQVLPVVIPLDGDRHVIAIEDNYTILSFTIANAAPPVKPTNIYWRFSSSFSNDPYTNTQDITGLSTRTGDSLYAFSNNNLTLNISRLNQSDEGRYFMIATNPAGEHYSHIDLIIHGPPYFVEKPSNETIINTRNVSFTCYAVADPAHQVNWTFNDTKQLPNTHSISSNDKYSVIRENGIRFGQLTVFNVSYDDRGLYQCTVYNNVSSLSASALLTVHVQPVVYSISTSISLLITNPVTIHCIATGYPYVNIQWKKNSQPLNPNSSPNITINTTLVTEANVLYDRFIPNIERLGSVGFLTFTSLARDDTANYSCVASNSLDITGVLSDESSSTVITVLERPDPPTNVSVLRYTSRTVTISWSPAFNGNNPIQGYFLYQKDLDRNSDEFIYVHPSSPHSYTTVVGTNSFTVSSGVIPYTKYQFAVVACNSVEGTNCSDVLRGIPSTPVRIDPDAPDSPPYNCIAIPYNSTAIHLTWSTPLQPNGLIHNYTISYIPLVSVSGLDYTQEELLNETSTDSNDTTIIINDLWKATSYNFSLRAFTVVGGSPLAIDICNNFTLEDNPDRAPLNIATVPLTSTSVRITWSPPPSFYQNGDITNYRIRYTTNLALSPLEQTVDDQLSTTISGLRIYQDYYFTVSAGTVVGYGPYSSPVVQKTLNDTSSPPASLRVVGITGRTNLTVTWNIPFDTNGIIMHYNVYYKPYKANAVNDSSYDPSERVQQVDSTTLTLTLTGLYPNSTYTVSVTAINGAGESQRSNEVSTNTQSSPPPPLDAPVIPFDAVDGRSVRIRLVRPSTINGLISHYQVVAVLVGGSSPPATSPDTLFPSLDSFHTYQQIKDEGIPDTGYIAAEFSASLFPSDSMYTIGDVSQPHDRNYNNGPLRYGSSYTFFLRAYPLLSTNIGSNNVKQTVTTNRQYSEFTSSDYTAVVTTVTNPAPAIAGSVVTILLVIIIVTGIVVVIVVAVVYNRRRRGILTFGYKDNNQEIRSMTSDYSLPSIPNPAYQETDGIAVGNAQQYEGHPPISVGEFPKIVDRLHANDNYMFSQEYDEICCKSPHPSVDVCLNPMNKLRNRYANIQCYDHTRVKLNPVEDFPHDYINANFLHGYKRPNEYIATQGPLPDTVGDFWRMVWDHKIPTIIMLTNLVEKMRVKCSQYWPDTIGATESFGYISVTFVKSTSHADYCVREFEIQARDQKETRTIRQYHYTSWPDFGVPRHATPLIQFIHTIRRYHKYEDTTPMIVHCSAGVGRTGTLVSIDVEMQRAENEGELCPYQFVRNLREDRNHMVQTEAQYIFVHDALVEVLSTEWTDISIDQLEDKMTELEIESEEGETGYLKEFNRLQEEAQRNYYDDFASARNDANRDKNRIHNAIPYDHNRVKLSKVPGVIGSDYINASFIDGYKAKDVFIATQGPLNKTVADFWRMICEQQVSVIVMLTNLEERGRVMSVQYWPEEIGDVVTYGNVAIQLEQEMTLDEYIHRQLKITNTTRDSSETRIIHHFNFIAWPKSGAPQSGAGMVDLIDQITKKQQTTGNKPIVVHCGSGIGRTGAFCALSIAIERVKVEQLLNVYSIVKHLRTQRAHMVQTVDQHIFIYRAVLEYAQSLSAYGNFTTVI